MICISTPVVGQMCDKGCEVDTCHNNGVCQEMWRDGLFSCNCHENGFSGERCEKGMVVTKLIYENLSILSFECCG